MKYAVIFSSGTGGHVYPALRLAEDLIKEKYKIIWVGTVNGLENTVVKNDSISIKHISATGFRGKKLLTKFMSIFLLFKSIYESYKILKNIKPDIVIGFGGYVSISGALVSFLLRIPFVIHEQNAIAGSANHLSFYFANRVYETFPGSFAKFNNKIIHTGNLVRNKFLNCKNPEEIYSENIFHLKILVLGGSQGSSFINKTLPFAISHFPKDIVEVKHISGVGKSENIQEKYDSYGISAKVIEYSDDINKLFDWSSLIVCRAGSTTISELASIGRACILIPFPNATDNHQLKNAEYLSDNSAAITLQQTDDFIENFVTTTNFLILKHERLYSLAQNIKKIFPKNASFMIIEDIKKIISKNEN